MAALKVMEDASMEHAGIVMGSGRGLVVVVVVVVVRRVVVPGAADDLLERLVVVG